MCQDLQLSIDQLPDAHTISSEEMQSFTPDKRKAIKFKELVRTLIQKILACEQLQAVVAIIEDSVDYLIQVLSSKT